MRKYNSVTYEVGKAKAEQAAGMFGLAADQRAASCPSRVAKPLAKPLTGGWRSATYARSQQSVPCFSVLSRVMRKLNSVTYEVGKAKAEQASGMFGLAADQRAASCPSRVAKPLAKPLTGGWRSATYARSQQSAPCFSRSICSSDFILI